MGLAWRSMKALLVLWGKEGGGELCLYNSNSWRRDEGRGEGGFAHTYVFVVPKEKGPK